ncbi:MAG: hypothetical protein GTO02_00750 [Candidatus Dadabacteria bacterium]|nr:hypothetical protein [Candidatus Dadabacteria bacterium]NIQ12974.1 hypothetical protein [Candidatus Dadabacteria bacterium]
MYKQITRFAFILLTIIVIHSCAGGSSSDNNNANEFAPLRITIKPSGELVDSDKVDLTNAAFFEDCEYTSISVSVSGADFSPIFVTFGEGETPIVLVPAGENRTFGVSLDGPLGTCCSGNVTTDIIPGVANDVSVGCDVPIEICTNGVDDNANAAVDCDDEDCLGQVCDGDTNSICVADTRCEPPAPPETFETSCDDGEDNDGDGFVDCDDLNCFNSPSCVEICNDGEDNDGDGAVDCDDFGCFLHPNCLPTNCDCNLAECAGQPCSDIEVENGICVFFGCESSECFGFCSSGAAEQ